MRCYKNCMNIFKVKKKNLILVKTYGKNNFIYKSFFGKIKLSDCFISFNAINLKSKLYDPLISFPASLLNLFLNNLLLKFAKFSVGSFKFRKSATIKFLSHFSQANLVTQNLILTTKHPLQYYSIIQNLKSLYNGLNLG